MISTSMRKGFYTYFGRKPPVLCREVWRRFGAIRRYVEPFCGSANMIFCKPDTVNLYNAVLNDLDSYVVNALRTMKYFHQIFIDLWIPAWELEFSSARTYIKMDNYHKLRKCPEHCPYSCPSNREELRQKLLGDMDYCCPVLGQMWVYVQNCWIGNAWNNSAMATLAPVSRDINISSSFISSSRGEM